MIKILKDGVLPKPTKVIYQTTCQHCDCVFEFEQEDIKSQERGIGGRITVECPCCHKRIEKASFRYVKRIVEVEDE